MFDILKKRAKDIQKRLTFVEYLDDRTYYAAKILAKENIAKEIFFVGPKELVSKKFQELGIDQQGITLVDPQETGKLDGYSAVLFEKRKAKGLDLLTARDILEKNILAYGALMLDQGDTDAVVAGAYHSTADVLKTSIPMVGLAPGIKTVSGAFLLEQESTDRFMIFADCAVTPDPTSEQLADIASGTVETYRHLLNEEPIVAFLSFSTHGSASHPMTHKVRDAVNILKERKVDFEFDGEFQFDAAFSKEVGLKKAPNSNVAGRANCFIFPNLDSGNIGYKIAQRIGGCEAYGPIIQGLSKPFSDLSRGASVNDIVNTGIISILLT